jgi:hypothetical protein
MAAAEACSGVNGAVGAAAAEVAAGVANRISVIVIELAVRLRAGVRHRRIANTVRRLRHIQTSKAKLRVKARSSRASARGSRLLCATPSEKPKRGKNVRVGLLRQVVDVKPSEFPDFNRVGLRLLRLTASVVDLNYFGSAVIRHRV